MMLDTLCNTMPCAGKLLMASPRTVLNGALLVNRNPTEPDAVNAPFNSTTGVLTKPGCVVASIVTELVTVGSALNKLIGKGGAPLILNVIVFGPGLALALKIAWRNEPAPLSAVVITVN